MEKKFNVSDSQLQIIGSTLGSIFGPSPTINNFQAPPQEEEKDYTVLIVGLVLGLAALIYFATKKKK